MKLSIIVIAKNEEDRIQACLESVKWADELIVADNGSSDKTVEIARKYTDKIVNFAGQDFAGLRNKALAKTNSEWVFYVDADERVLQPLREEILKIIQETSDNAFAVRRENVIFGQKVEYGPYKNDWMIRLFRKSAFKDWVGEVHEHGEFEGGLGYLKNSLLHLTHRDIDHIVLKSLEWSKIDARLRFQSHHPPMTGYRFLRILLTESYNQGIKRRGFFGGTVGVMDSFLQVFSLFITYVRLWQLQQPKSIEEVYQDIDKQLLQNDFISK